MKIECQTWQLSKFKHRKRQTYPNRQLEYSRTLSILQYLDYNKHIHSHLQFTYFVFSVCTKMILSQMRNHYLKKRVPQQQQQLRRCHRNDPAQMKKRMISTTSHMLKINSKLWLKVLIVKPENFSGYKTVKLTLTSTNCEWKRTRNLWLDMLKMALIRTYMHGHRSCESSRTTWIAEWQSIYVSLKQSTGKGKDNLWLHSMTKLRSHPWKSSGLWFFLPLLWYYLLNC